MVSIVLTTNKEPFRILLPTDGSIPALVATRHAVDLVKHRNGRLIILTVKEATPITPIEKLAEDAALMRTIRVDGMEYAKKIAERAQIPFDLKIRDGSVVGEIIKTAEEFNVDQIVMGSSNPKGLSGFFLGHVAEAVIKAAPFSVTVIKPTQKDILAIKESAKEFILERVEPAVERLEGNVKFRVGLALFIAYALGYIAYTVFGSFQKDVFAIKIIGLNIGIVGGMTLILSAIVIAITYNWFAGKLDNQKGK